MTTEINKNALRELILDFYTTYDPERLRIGIDVSGMVDWTFDHGLEALNEMLSDQYGAEINPNKQVNNNSKEAMARISAALMGPIDTDLDKRKRAEISEKLERFYQLMDPSKLAGMDKIIEFAMYRGVNILNEKLRAKYGKDLDSFREASADQFPDKQMLKEMQLPQREIEPPIAPQRQPVAPPRFERPQPPVRKVPARPLPAAPFPVPREIPSIPPIVNPPRAPSRQTVQSELPPPPPSVAALEEVGDDDSLPPPPPPMEVDPNEIQAELEGFYKYHDKAKLDVVEGLVYWVMNIGRDEFNKKLLQLYGSDLDDPIPENKKRVETMKLEASVHQSRAKSNSTPKSIRDENDFNDNEQFSDEEEAFPTKSMFKPPPGNFSDPTAPHRFAPKKPSEMRLPTPHFKERNQPLNVSERGPPPMTSPKIPMTGTLTGKLDLNVLSSQSFKNNKDSSFSVLASNAYLKQQSQRSIPDPYNKRTVDQKPGGHLKMREEMKKTPAFSSGRVRPIPEPSSNGNFASQAAKMRQQRSDRQLPKVADRHVTKATDFNKGTTCKGFQLDMNAKSFGVCVCGRPRAAHPSNSQVAPVAPKKIPQAMSTKLNLTMKAASPRPSSFEEFENKAFVKPSHEMKLRKACNNYLLDMTGSTFGVCKCGFPRADHARR